MNTQPGQPFSLVTLSGDRDTVLQYYLSKASTRRRWRSGRRRRRRGRGQDGCVAECDGGAAGVHRPRAAVGGGEDQAEGGGSQVLVHPGDPLDQTALLETQRNLYNIALFNEVVTAVQNPAGGCSAEECAAAVDGGEAVERDVWVRHRGADGNAAVGHDLGGIVHPVDDQSVQQDYAGRQDGSEPAGFAGCVADQPVGDAGLADAAFVVWIAGAGGDSDACRIRTFVEPRMSRRRFRAGTRTFRILRRSSRRRCREIFGLRRS